MIDGIDETEGLRKTIFGVFLSKIYKGQAVNLGSSTGHPRGCNFGDNQVENDWGYVSVSRRRHRKAV